MVSVLDDHAQHICSLASLLFHLANLTDNGLKSRTEFVDLAKFLTQLGKAEGDYEPTVAPIIRRWRL